jgi:phage terminase large subunit-like protein
MPDGSRLIRIVWIEIGRKNGKTEWAAGASLLALLGDGEHGGQVYSMAVDKNQAKIVFNKAGVMVNYSKPLSKLITVLKTSLHCPELNASFMPLSAGSGGKHGLSPSAAIGDEVHEWTDGGELADVVHKGTAARRQPLEIYITTAGVKGIGYAWEMHELALQIERGEIKDPRMLVVRFAPPDDADWRVEETWRAANPNYGVSVKPEYMQAEFEKAKRSPLNENNFKRYHLNLWTEQVTRWLPMENSEGSYGWNGCSEDPGDKFLWKSLRDRMRRQSVYGGLDLALTRDLSSLCWTVPAVREGERHTFIWRFWLPAERLNAEPLARRRRYEYFAEIGALVLTPGNVTDFAAIRKAIVEDSEWFNVQWLGIDRYNAAQLASELKEQDGVPVEYFGQGFLSMSPPTKSFERLVLNGELEHGNNPVAQWMARNAAVEEDAAGNLKPTKGKAPDKIDGIVAAIMALGRSMLDTETGPYSDGRPLLVL